MNSGTRAHYPRFWKILWIFLISDLKPERAKNVMSRYGDLIKINSRNDSIIQSANPDHRGEVSHRKKPSVESN